MSAEENKAIARRFYEDVLSQGKLDALDGLFADNYVDHQARGAVGTGVDAIRQQLSMFLSAFPDLSASVEDLIAEGDKVVARVTYRGTHQGTLFGIAPTGRQVSVTGIDILRIANGKVVEHWGEQDNLSLMQQLGAIPASGQTGA